MADARCLNRIAKRIGHIGTFVTNFSDEDTIDNVRINIQLLEEEWSEFKSLEGRIKFDPEITKVMDGIEDNYFVLKTKLLKIQSEVSEQNADYTVQDLLVNQKNFLEEAKCNKRTGEDEIRLPRMNIPIFSGVYSEFPSFRDLFQASVGRKANVSGAQKLQYLKGLLIGDAAALVRHIEITDANYGEAWGIIKERYDNKRYVVTNLLKRFTDQPSIIQPSATALHHMSDIMEEVLRGLKVVGPQAETRDPWLISTLVNKLDAASKQAWALEICDEDFPTLEQFKRFLKRRGNALGDCEVKRPTQIGKSQAPKVKLMHITPKTTTCRKCNSDHDLHNCENFLELNVTDRRGFIAEQKLCFNCLRANHQAAVCKSRFRCIKCRAKHHTTLHKDSNEITTTGNEAASSAVMDPSKSYQTTTETINEDSQINANTSMSSNFQALLPTAVVQIRDNLGKYQKCRILLDSGAQASFISERCMQRLQLSRKNANISIKGLTSDTTQTKGKTSICLTSCYDHQQIEIEVLILNKLPTRLPSQYFDIKNCGSINQLKFADPDYNKPNHIDVMIGADKFFNILREGRIENCGTTLVAQNTIFGWVLGGDLKYDDPNQTQANFLSYNFHSNVSNDELLRKFWELEEIQNCDPFTEMERKCETHFKSNYRRDKQGRCIVKIPFRESIPKLGNSFHIAERRFFNLERRLNANQKLKHEYVRVMREYIELGHMREIPYGKNYINSGTCFYLPHHCVVKESSKTTKIRVVFDGSCKSSNGLSINDNMLVGPTIQPTLWSTLMRFRYHKIALAADIEKMYRQVMVAEEDQKYQKIVWRENESEPLKHFVLTTVTFGLASSAFLAIRALHQSAFDMENQLPDIAEVIRNDFYVDDLLTGADSIEKAKRLKQEIQNVIGKSQFKLRKWMSNVKDLADVADAHESVLKIEEAEASASILGIQWNSAKDTFSFTVKLPETAVLTKRELISSASKVFDPLGWVSPSTIIAKMLFQALWLRKLEWDDELPEDIAKIWNQLRGEFSEFKQLNIQRYVPSGEAELHGFSDASERAYSAVVYCRSIDEEGTIHVSLVTSKTKVAPIKQVSLPRLELCGAHLLAKLLIAVKGTMPSTTKVYAWTDSAIVLAWLSDHPIKWKTFIGNRTSEILNLLTRQHWNHIKSDQNPADHASRGVFPSKLLTLQQWWRGPAWLELKSDCWPTCDDACDNTNLERRNKVAAATHVLHYQNSDDIIAKLINKTFSFNKLIRILSFVNRFIANVKIKPDERKCTPLTVKELEHSTKQVIKYVQNAEFHDEIRQLKAKKELSAKSNLLPLTPFLDGNEILRVGGRLEKSMSEYDSKYPIILPKSHILSRMIVSYVHNKYLHPGPSLTSHLIRQKYWIVRGRGLVREELKKCVKCFRQRAANANQLMGNLPAVRTTPARPFSKCGVDYAGPISIANKRGRGAKMSKGYIAVFVCMVTKAIHLEAVTDLTSDAFIAALKRFSSRRGVPNEIFSDNGTNFVGARRQLNEVYKMLKTQSFSYLIAEFLAQNAIQWHTIPPAAPHFGGLWEAAVKSVKSHLNKATNDCNLTFEEMSTLLSQIEAILNSRPLCTLSEDDTTIEALTPSHFLIGSTISSIPEIDSENVPISRLSRWQQIQQRVKGFWKRFNIEYLNSLQQRNKWTKKMENIKINDLVLIKEDNLPSCKWALGRIVDVHPDENGLIRVVSIKTPSTTIKRPIVKVCKLPNV